MQTHSAAQNSGPPLPPPRGTQSGKTLIEAFGDKIHVDDLTFYECVIAHKQGVIFRWIGDVDNISYKIMLRDQDFNQ